MLKRRIIDLILRNDNAEKNFVDQIWNLNCAVIITFADVRQAFSNKCYKDFIEFIEDYISVNDLKTKYKFKLAYNEKGEEDAKFVIHGTGNEKRSPKVGIAFSMELDGDCYFSMDT
jgi:hypothetical protein